MKSGYEHSGQPAQKGQGLDGKPAQAVRGIINAVFFFQSYFTNTFFFNSISFISI